MRLELIRVDEGVDPHGAEEMADALSDLFFGHVLADGEGWGIGSPVGPAQDAAEHAGAGGGRGGPSARGGTKGQTEAAQSLGLSNYQSMTLIILPQALRSIIPPLTNQFLNLTKNSSLSVVIAYPELFMVSRTIMNNSGRALPVFFLILFTYLSLSLIISLFMNFINRRVTRIGA